MGKICYYGDKISPNIAMTPEGYMICQNVPIARTGYQKYLGSELWEDGNCEEIINVYRPSEEVFSPATLASFEGKPVTNDHPDEDVTPENVAIYSKGHVQNVRVGTGKDANKILADLYITDPDLIAAIKDGKREISAGYYADEDDDGDNINQRKIRGNHVAVVDEGRAGRSVCIRDSKQNIGGMNMARISKKQKIARIVARYLRDASPEDLDERIEDAAEVLSDVNDDDMMLEDDEFDGGDDALLAEEDDTALLADDDIDLDGEDDALLEDDDDLLTDDDIDVDGEDDLVIEDDDEEITMDEDELEEAEIESENLDIIPTDEVEARLSARDSAIRKITRAAMKIRDPRDRLRVQDAIIQATSKGRKSQMKGLMNMTSGMKRKRMDSAGTGKMINVERQEKIYESFNPHKNNKK